MPQDVLIVTAKRPGFRRAGRAWPDSAVTIPLDALTGDELDAIEVEPMLVSHRARQPDEAPAPADDKPPDRRK